MGGKGSGRKKSGWHTSIYAGQKESTLYGKHGKVLVKTPLTSSGQGFSEIKKKRGKK